MDPTCYNDTSCVVVRDSVWTKIDDFMCKAFTWAREADPTALLFYNDFNHSTKEGYWEVKSTAIYDLVNDLKTRNCGIDGVGFQLHEDIDFSSRVANVKTNIQRYLDIDVLVHFTEVDIKCRKDSNDVCEDWTDANLAAQATTYGDLLTACLEYSNCESFETWGFTDKYTWHAAPMYPLPWDENFNKKSTYDTLLSTLQNFDRSNAAVTTRVANRDTRAEYLYLDGSVKVGIASSALLVSLLFTTW
jgi:endo-1,4-beta-xylanase